MSDDNSIKAINVVDKQLKISDYSVDDYVKKKVNFKDFLSIELQYTKLNYFFTNSYNAIKNNQMVVLVITILEKNKVHHLAFDQGKYLYYPISVYIEEITNDFNLQNTKVLKEYENIDEIINNRNITVKWTNIIHYSFIIFLAILLLFNFQFNSWFQMVVILVPLILAFVSSMLFFNNRSDKKLINLIK